MIDPNASQQGGNHYSGTVLMHWDVCATFNVGYVEGLATKYLTRWRNKDGLKDLLKAQHCIQKIQSLIEEEDYEAFGEVPGRIIRTFLDANDIQTVSEREVIAILFRRFDAGTIKKALLLMRNIINEEGSKA